MTCQKCGKPLVKVAGHWIHRSHEDFADCRFNEYMRTVVAREETGNARNCSSSSLGGR